jgi:hypothetical protein
LAKLLSIVVCDDDVTRALEWSSEISEIVGKDAAVLTTLTGRDLSEALEALFGRSRDHGGEREDAAKVFDGADVLIIDSDLTPDEETLAQLPAEDVDLVRDGLSGQVGDSVAYAARVFTSAQTIVLVNQGYSDRTFDLTMRRFAASIADLYVAEGDLLDPQLWKPDKPEGQYRPWAWPALINANELVQASRQAVHDLDAPVSGILSLNTDELYAEQLDVFGDEDPTTATFRQFAASQLGLRPRDLEGIDDVAIKRVAASVLTRWIERFLVAPQNLVADAAHLIQRFPAVFGVEQSAKSWTEVANSSGAGTPDGELGAAESPLSAFSHRVLFDVSTVRELAKQSQAEPLPYLDVVFAEDTSRFVPIEEAVEVLTALPGSNARRYVEEVEDIRYIPRVRRL